MRSIAAGFIVLAWCPFCQLERRPFLPRFARPAFVTLRYVGAVGLVTSFFLVR